MEGTIVSWLDALTESAGEFVGNVASNGSDALLQYSKNQINDALGNAPTQSALTSATPERAVDQIIEPSSTASGDAARVQALTNTLSETAPKLLLAAVAVVGLMMILRRV